jgi:hypothetical protein
MKNYWLGTAKKKRMLTSIDDVGMEVWSKDGTLGDFLSGLNKEQKSFIMSMNMADFICEINEDRFIIELIHTN